MARIGKGVLRLDGIRQLKDGLQLFAQEVNGGHVSHDVFLQIANDTIIDMQDHAPVDTGFLRDHIRLEDVSAYGIFIISEAPYSGYVEFGTSKMQAQPYFIPAIENNFKDAFPQMFMNALSDEWAFIVRKFSPRGFGSIKSV